MTTKDHEDIKAKSLLFDLIAGKIDKDQYERASKRERSEKMLESRSLTYGEIDF